MIVVDELKLVVSELLAEDELPVPAPNVELLDPAIARLYATSQRAQVGHSPLSPRHTDC